jgi:hypothetical protein
MLAARSNQESLFGQHYATNAEQQESESKRPTLIMLRLFACGGSVRVVIESGIERFPSTDQLKSPSESTMVPTFRGVCLRAFFGS